MSQRWTIVDIASGTVLCACFETASPDAHPRDSGWSWVEGTQQAVAIDAVPNTAAQVFNGTAWVAGSAPASIVVQPTMISRLAFQRRFTQAERIAVRGSVDPVVIDFRELAALPESIDLADADVIAGTQYLEALGLIGAGRAAFILAGEVPHVSG